VLPLIVRDDVVVTLCPIVAADEGDQFDRHAPGDCHPADRETEGGEDALCCTEWSRGQDLRLVSSPVVFCLASSDRLSPAPHIYTCPSQLMVPGNSHIQTCNNSTLKEVSITQ